jgi:hypothetical protein
MEAGLVQAVTGELSYLDPQSTVLRRFTAPARPRHSIEFRTIAYFE